MLLRMEIRSGIRPGIFNIYIRDTCISAATYRKITEIPTDISILMSVIIYYATHNRYSRKYLVQCITYLHKMYGRNLLNIAPTLKAFWAQNKRLKIINKEKCLTMITKIVIPQVTINLKKKDI